ncbi:hypothetical protein HY620_02055 [Candidatus Uhrbacteria bacterium]|nr:hypothetical protein [Candidatus Uhrbacteria bacterium]
MSELEKIVGRQKQKRNKRKTNIELAKEMRRQGATYRTIGKQLGIDFGYARRLTKVN